MTRRNRMILVAHVILTGYVLIQVSWSGPVVSKQVDTLIFFSGAILFFSGCLYLLINFRKKGLDRYQPLEINRSRS
jgi:hypothetical protein